MGKVTQHLTIAQLTGMLPHVGWEKDSRIKVNTGSGPGVLHIEMFPEEREGPVRGQVMFLRQDGAGPDWLVATVFRARSTMTYKLGVPGSHSSQEWGLKTRVENFILDLATTGWDDDPFDLGREAWVAN